MTARRDFLYAAIAATGACSLVSQTTVSSAYPQSAEAQAIRGAEEAHEKERTANAAQDVAGWSKVVADDLMTVLANGTVLDKQARIAEIQRAPTARYPQPLRERPEYRARVYGETVILTWSAPLNGFRVVEVFVKKNGVWLLAHSQQTTVRT